MQKQLAKLAPASSAVPAVDLQGHFVLDNDSWAGRARLPGPALAAQAAGHPTDSRLGRWPLSVPSCGCALPPLGAPYLGQQGGGRQDEGLFRSRCCLQGGQEEHGGRQAGGGVLHGGIQGLVIKGFGLLHEGAGASDQGST